MPDLRFQSQPPRHTEIPRPKRAEGQWSLGYTEPLNKNEQSKKDDDPLNVRARILNIYSKRGFDSIDPADLGGRFRWMGLYTQRKPGIDGGKTAILEEHELDDSYFMLRVRSDGRLLSPEAVRALGSIGVDFARDTADVTDRENIQYHWIRIEDVPAIWDRLDAAGLSSLEACGDSPRPFLGSPVAGVAKDEIIDGSAALDEIFRRYIGDPRFSNLPRKFKTALTGHPSHDVSPETNDVAFVGTVHPELGPGFDLWVGGGLSTNPMLAQKAGVWIPHRGRARRVGGRRVGLPRLRLPAAALARPAQVPGRRLGHRQVPRGPRERVPRPHARAHALPAVAGRPPRPHRRARAEGRRLLRRPGADRGSGQRHGARRAGRPDGRVRGPRRPADAVPEDRADRRRGPTRVEPLLDRLDAIGLSARPSQWRQNTMACTGIEFCKLAIVDTKNRARDLVAELEQRFPDLDTPITVNVNGCPNACARTQCADIGLKGQLVLDDQGNQVEGFQVHLGGATGLNANFGRKLRAHKVTSAELDDYVTAVVTAYLDEREDGESFADLGRPRRRAGPAAASASWRPCR